MNATLYKDFSDASECIVIVSGQPLYKSVDCTDRRIIANGQEVTPDYIPNDGDIIIIRSIPYALSTGLLIASISIAAISVGVGIYAGVQAYQARKQAEELTERMKNMRDDIANVPNLRGASNSLAKGKTQPYVMGEHLFTPYLLTAPHYEISGTDGANQYYYAVMEGGFNDQVIRSVSADDIKLKTFTGDTPQEGSFKLDAGVFCDSAARIEISQDGNSFAESHFNAVYATQTPGAELKKADADDYEDLIFSLPQNAADVVLTILFRGLRGYADDGSKVNRTVVVKPYYSLNAGSTWTEFFFNQNGSNSNTFSRNEVKEMRFNATLSFSYSTVKDLTEPVLIKLVCPTNKASSAMDQVYVQYVRSKLYDVEASASAGSYVYEKPLADTESDLSTRIGVKLKATLSNQDKLGKINVITSGVARTWTGSAWTSTKTPTSNLAAWMLEVLTSHTHGPSQLDDSEIDLDAFGKFYEYCEEEGINVNQVLIDADEKTNVMTQLCDIGGAMLYENIYGEVSVAVDSPKTNAIAVLNAQNLLSFEVEREFSRETDGIRISYVSSEAGYQQDSYLVMRDGVTRGADSIIRDITVQGITDYEQIVKYARRLMAIEKLRPRTVTASVGKEGVYYTPLAKVLVQHPALSNGVGSAEIKSVIVEGGNITALELYEPVTYDLAHSFGAIIQAVGDDYCTPLAVQYTGDVGRNTIIDLVTPISTGAAVIPHPGDILSYGYIVGGEFDTITSEMMLLGIEPTDEGFSLTLVDYNEAIYEPGAIPDYVPNVTYVPSPVSSPSGLPPATLEDVNTVVITPLSTAPATPASISSSAFQDRIDCTTVPGGSAGLDNQTAYFRYQLSRDGGSSWPVEWNGAATSSYTFDRDIDGYPEAATLANYRIRAYAVSPSGVVSSGAATTTPSTTGYGTWVPSVPGLSGSADARIAQLKLLQGSTYYGHNRFEVQIQRSGDSSWYAPGDSAAARDSETAYRGALNGYASAYADTFAQTLPLINQAAGLPENTSYLYRIRAVVAKPTTAAPDAVARSAWTAAITVVAKPTGTVDIVEKAVKTAQLDDLAVEAGKLGPGAVLTEKLADAAVEVSKIKDAAVEAAKIKDGAIIAEKISAGAVVADKIGANAVTADKILAGSVTAAKIAAGAVETAKLAANAVTADKIEAQAITTEKLHVLAKNLVNDLTDDADGTTGWNLRGGSTVEVDSTIGRRALNMPAITHASHCTPFAVGPNDIIEVDVSFRAITASTGARLRLGIDGVAQLQYATWDTTAKAWGAFGGSTTFRDCGITASTASYTAIKSYIVGQNVNPADIPAPVNAVECVRVVSSPAVGIGLVVSGTASRVYFFAPSARKVGAGKIVAQQIVTPNLAAISAKLGEIHGDTADYKLVMGSGGSAEEGTLLLGATTDASYFRRWKEGGVWKMAIKLATLFVDAVSSKILGIFRVRNSADTSTVFEVDPVNGISSLINHKLGLTGELVNKTLSLASNGSTRKILVATLPWDWSGDISIKGTGLSIQETIDIQIDGGYGAHGPLTAHYGKHLPSYGVKAIKVYSATADWNSTRYLYIDVDQAPSATNTYNILKVHSQNGSITLNLTEAASYSGTLRAEYTLPSNRAGLITGGDFVCTGLTTLAAVTANSLAVAGAVSAASLGGLTPTSSVPGVSVSNNSTGYGVYVDNNNGYGVRVYNNSVTGVYVDNNNGTGVYVDNNSGYGVYVDNNSVTGVYVDNTGGYGVYVDNTSTGYGVYVDNTSTGYGVYVDNNSGTGVYVDNTSTGYGVRVYNTGGTGVYVENTGTGYGVRVYNTGGYGVSVDNSGTGYGVYAVSTSSSSARKPIAKFVGSNIVIPYISTTTTYGSADEAINAHHVGTKENGSMVALKYNQSGEGLRYGIYVYFDGAWKGA